MKNIKLIKGYLFLFFININVLYGDIDLSVDKKIKLDESRITISNLNIASIDKEGNIYLIDYPPIRVLKFDGSGKFQKVLVEKGPGPSEILFVKNIAIDEKKSRLLMVDIEKNALLIFDKNGKYIDYKRFSGYADTVKVNSYGDVYMIYRRQKGGLIVSKLNRNYQDVEQFFEYSGKGEFKSFSMKLFLMDFDSEGKIYTAESFIYRINVFNRYGKPVRTFGEPGKNFKSLTSDPPLPVGSSKFKKWQESFDGLYSLYIVNNKYCIVFYRTAMKRDAIFHYDIYSLYGAKFASGSLPYGMRPLEGKDSNGNVYCRKVAISRDGTNVNHWIYKYVIRDKKK